MAWEMFDIDCDQVITLGDQYTWLADVKRALPGDADLNGRVELSDFLILSDNFGESGGWTSGDFDFSGEVQLSDFLLLSENFGKSAGRSASIPEPNARYLLVAGTLSYLGFRRRRPSRVAPVLLLACLVTSNAQLQTDIWQRDTRQAIPGTEGIRLDPRQLDRW